MGILDPYPHSTGAPKRNTPSNWYLEQQEIAVNKLCTSNCYIVKSDPYEIKDEKLNRKLLLV